ncbi:unnamed protein product [Lota lota]
MLQQILKDMYIDPDVLDALSEDQKKTLFLKMRQEQVRRWKEREEKVEREGGLGEPLRIRPKRANAKSVTWQLGRDGDIAVIVIGEVDEFKSSKIISSGFGEKKVPVLHDSAGLKSNLVQKSTTEPARKENLPPKTQHTAPPNAKECSKEVSALPPLQVSLSERVSPPAVEKSELNPGSAPSDSPPSPATTIFHPATRTGVITVRPASMLAALGVAKTSRAKVNQVTMQTDPDPPTPTQLAAAAAAAAELPVPTAAPRACYQLLKPQRATPQEPGGRDGTQYNDVMDNAQAAIGSVSATATCGGRGRVAQLMKTFNAESPSALGQAAARTPKPPLPSKPSHLRLMKSSTVR